MNVIDAVVIKVLDHMVLKTRGKEQHIYTVEYADMGGEGITRIILNEENAEIKEGFKFRH